MADDVTYAPDWEDKVAFMRSRQLVRATWSSEGALTSAEVVPLPVPLTPEEEATQRTSSPDRVERDARAERRRISMLASGGPLRALADDRR